MSKRLQPYVLNLCIDPRMCRELRKIADRKNMPIENLFMIYISDGFETDQVQVAS